VRWIQTWRKPCHVGAWALEAALSVSVGPKAALKWRAWALEAALSVSVGPEPRSSVRAWAQSRAQV